jgi:hypothetical protein
VAPDTLCGPSGQGFGGGGNVRSMTRATSSLSAVHGEIERCAAAAGRVLMSLGPHVLHLHLAFDGIIGSGRRCRP